MTRAGNKVTLHSSWQCEVSVGPQLGIPPVQQSEQGMRLLPTQCSIHHERAGPCSSHAECEKTEPRGKSRSKLEGRRRPVPTACSINPSLLTASDDDVNDELIVEFRFIVSIKVKMTRTNIL